jgi:hypothetical protein
MQLPTINNAPRYVGLYVIDFGDHSGVGFTAEEAAELLDSEKFKDIKVYKIHNAYPDGRLELRGVRPQLFQVEIGMFFYSHDSEAAQRDYKELLKLAVEQSPPSRAKLQLAKYADDKYVVALIFPAEYNDEYSAWLLDNDYKTSGEAIGGISAVQQYYQDKPEILKRYQLMGSSQYESRTGEELLSYTKVAVQR